MLQHFALEEVHHTALFGTQPEHRRIRNMVQHRWQYISTSDILSQELP